MQYSEKFWKYFSETEKGAGDDESGDWDWSHKEERGSGLLRAACIGH